VYASVGLDHDAPAGSAELVAQRSADERRLPVRDAPVDRLLLRRMHGLEEPCFRHVNGREKSIPWKPRTLPEKAPRGLFNSDGTDAGTAAHDQPEEQAAGEPKSGTHTRM
jgi:hypothetical protein